MGLITIWGMKVNNIGEFKKISMVRVKDIDGTCSLGGRLIDLTACHDGRLAWCADRFIQVWDWQKEEAPRKIAIPDDVWGDVMYVGRLADCGNRGLVLGGGNTCWIADLQGNNVSAQGDEQLTIAAQVDHAACSSGILAIPGGFFVTSKLVSSSAELKTARQILTFRDVSDLNQPSNPQTFVVPLYEEKKGSVRMRYPCCMAYLNRGKGGLFTGSRDGKIRLYDPETFLCLKTIKTEASVSSLCFIPEEGLLISGHDDGSIRVWQ